MSTTKLTRAEACAELARRLGWTAERDELLPEAYWQATHSEYGKRGGLSHSADEALARANPYFTSRDAAAELVAWIRQSIHLVYFKFIATLEDLALQMYGAGHDPLMRIASATSEQITLAACAALGIELEDAKNENE